jgi:hypothetical protein
MTRRCFLACLLAAGCHPARRAALVDPASYAPAASLQERARLNEEGRLEGYGACLECGDRWNWKPAHTIAYGAGQGMFPLCEYDYWHLPVERVADHIRRLVREWKALTPDEAEHLEEDARLAIAAMRAERGAAQGRQGGTGAVPR